MAFIKNIFFVMLLCFSFSAFAQDAEDVFGAWNTTKNYLASQGIDTAAINWTEINQLCLPLRTGADEKAFNKCSYEKAKDSALYTIDKSQCSIRAKGAYPDSFLKGRTDTLTETGKDGVVHTYQRTITSVSTQDLEQQRAAAVVECMQSLGWVDASNWHLGKRNPNCQ
jgi:hypothetical protein